MAAHPEQLRNRLEEAAAEMMLTKDVDVPNPKKSSHTLVTIKAPPNTARQEKSTESVQTETPVRPPLTPNTKKVKTVDSELRFIHRRGSGDHEEIDFHDRPILQQRIGKWNQLQNYLPYGYYMFNCSEPMDGAQVRYCEDGFTLTLYSKSGKVKIPWKPIVLYSLRQAEFLNNSSTENRLLKVRLLKTGK